MLIRSLFVSLFFGNSDEDLAQERLFADTLQYPNTWVFLENYEINGLGCLDLTNCPFAGKKFDTHKSIPTIEDATNVLRMNNLLIPEEQEDCHTENVSTIRCEVFGYQEKIRVTVKIVNEKAQIEVSD